MKQPPQWLLKWGLGAALLAAGTLRVLPLAQAQTDSTRPPLALSKTTTTPAVVGDTLIYILTLTNTGRSPLSGVVVTDTTPAGTTIFSMNGPEDWWMTTSSGQGRPGQVYWRLKKALAAGEVVILQFAVKVEPGAAGQLVSDHYEAGAEGWPEPAHGPAVISALLAPTPTWTPPPTPTSQPTATPTLTPIPTFTPVPPKTLTMTATPTVVTSPTQRPPSPPATAAIAHNFGGESNGRVLLWLGLAMMMGLVVVFIVIKRRR